MTSLLRLSLAALAALALAVSADAGPRPKPAKTKTVNATTPKTTHVKGTHAKTTRSTQAVKPPKAPKAPHTTKSTTTTTTTVIPTPTTTTASVVPKNPRLVNRLKAMLPPGTDINVAAQGFRNQGQFIAAVQNWYKHRDSFTFAELKFKMVDEGMSLGQAKQALLRTQTPQ